MCRKWRVKAISTSDLYLASVEIWCSVVSALIVAVIHVQVLNVSEYVVLDVRRTLLFLHKHFAPKKLWLTAGTLNNQLKTLRRSFRRPPNLQRATSKDGKTNLVNPEFLDQTECWLGYHSGVQWSWFLIEVHSCWRIQVLHLKRKVLLIDDRWCKVHLSLESKMFRQCFGN